VAPSGRNVRRRSTAAPTSAKADGLGRAVSAREGQARSTRRFPHKQAVVPAVVAAESRGGVVPVWSRPTSWVWTKKGGTCGAQSVAAAGGELC
jgi:hypothetical protein